MLPRHNGSGLALCSCSVLLPGIYAESGRHASYHQDSNPLSYVDRVGLDRFYNLRSACTRTPEISTCREKIHSVLSKVRESLRRRRSKYSRIILRTIRCIRRRTIRYEHLIFLAMQNVQNVL